MHQAYVFRRGIEATPENRELAEVVAADEYSKTPGDHVRCTFEPCFRTLIAVRGRKLAHHWRHIEPPPGGYCPAVGATGWRPSRAALADVASALRSNPAIANTLRRSHETSDVLNAKHRLCMGRAAAEHAIFIDDSSVIVPIHKENVGTRSRSVVAGNRRVIPIVALDDLEELNLRDFRSDLQRLVEQQPIPVIRPEPSGPCGGWSLITSPDQTDPDELEPLERTAIPIPIDARALFGARAAGAGEHWPPEGLLPIWVLSDFEESIAAVRAALEEQDPFRTKLLRLVAKRLLVDGGSLHQVLFHQSPEEARDCFLEAEKTFPREEDILTPKELPKVAESAEQLTDLERIDLVQSCLRSLSSEGKRHSEEEAKTVGLEAATLTERRRLQGEMGAGPVRIDDARFTVYRPRLVPPEEWQTLLAFAHRAEPLTPERPDPAIELQQQAKAILGEAASSYDVLAEDSAQAIPSEGMISFIPEVDGLRFNPRSRTFCWTENIHREEFRFFAEPRLDGRTARGRLTVFWGAIVLAELTLAIKVSSDAARQAEAQPAVTTSPYRKIFASYSHRDLKIVRHFKSFAETLGDRYLQDVVDLRAGEVWTEGIAALIRQADVFQLFWSKCSMRSAHVQREWKYALRLRRRGFVRPTYWQEPLPELRKLNLPPPELKRLHFQRFAPPSEAARPQEQAEKKPEEEPKALQQARAAKKKKEEDRRARRREIARQKRKAEQAARARRIARRKAAEEKRRAQPEPVLIAGLREAMGDIAYVSCPVENDDVLRLKRSPKAGPTAKIHVSLNDKPAGWVDARSLCWPASSDRRLIDRVVADLESFVANPDAWIEHAWKGENRCVVCGRKLTNPLSVALGIGPVCRKKYASVASLKRQLARRTAARRRAAGKRKRPAAPRPTGTRRRPPTRKPRA